MSEGIGDKKSIDHTRNGEPARSIGLHALLVVRPARAVGKRGERSARRHTVEAEPDCGAARSRRRRHKHRKRELIVAAHAGRARRYSAAQHTPRVPRALASHGTTLARGIAAAAAKKAAAGLHAAIVFHRVDASTAPTGRLFALFFARTAAALRHAA